jgi:hypothetical protein
MDFCFNCGGKTELDWDFCRACGTVLNDDPAPELSEPVAASTESPKVELISRGWDVVDVDTVELADQPLTDDEVLPAPLPPGAIEVSAGDLAVIESADPVEPSPSPPAAVDPWDHLRPHGEQPPRQHHVTIPARVTQTLLGLSAVAALAAAGIHFFLNTRLDAFVDGTTSSGAVDDAELVADMSLAILAGLLLLTVLALVFWLIQSRHSARSRPGKGGLVALLSFLGGAAVVTTSLVIRRETVTEAIAANSLIVIGLGLVITGCIAAVLTVQRVALGQPA